MVVDEQQFMASSGSTFAVANSRRPWDQLPSGTNLCIKTINNRSGVVTVTWTRNPDGIVDHVTVAGTLWRPVKERSSPALTCDG
ncbi:hypothetical protein JOF29_006835 [Kribbella aluminosa]|uniref:Ig-like domain-containing protein n=1 Tax=Kribbella aluminosa TaxID=416017 RepID=A0ABS4UVU3_9ACTN|nr:hypothetical protein [Kribbella aluminosa]MBP2355725.1 hypothetical protein [Kribbella aluminosa]